MRPFFNVRNTTEEAPASAAAVRPPEGESCFSSGMRAALHCIVLIISFVLVSLVYASEKSDLNRATFVIAPPDTPFSLIATLRGVVPLVAFPALGLFSEVNPAVLCLCAQALAVAFHLSTRTPPKRRDFLLDPTAAAEDEASPPSAEDNDDEDESTRQARWFLRKLSFGVLLCTAGLLLFMVERWHIPQNNLLLLELLLAVAFFSTGSHHHHHRRSHQQQHPELREAMLSTAFVLPLLCVASLVAAGEADALALLVSYVSTGGMLLLWCLLDRFQQGTEEEEEDVAIVLRLTIWLCAIPFGFYASLRLSAIEDGADWAAAALGLGLGWVIVLLLYFAFSSFASLYYQEILIWVQQAVLVAMSLCLQFGLLLSSSSSLAAVPQPAPSQQHH